MNKVELNTDGLQNGAGSEPAQHQQPLGKFSDPDITAQGEPRACVPLDQLETLWFNTGSLCNIECTHCYIFSSPKNDDLSYITLAEIIPFLDEIKASGLTTREIGFTGGEPFMNPQMIAMADEALSRGFEVLILTNAMTPMMRKSVRAGLLDLLARYGDRLTLRVSLDHYTAAKHDEERGAGSFDKSLEGLNWLNENGFRFAIAGRSLWDETQEDTLSGFADLFASEGWVLDIHNPREVVVFPEMDEAADVPEITTACWDILGLEPSGLLCASSRMVVKRRGEAAAKVLPCTLIPYRADFEMGTSLAESFDATGGMFDKGAVKLCHVHCAKFCVLGGGSCSA